VAELDGVADGTVAAAHYGKHAYVQWSVDEGSGDGRGSLKRYGLRLIAMVAIGAMRLAAERWSEEQGQLPARHSRECAPGDAAARQRCSGGMMTVTVLLATKGPAAAPM
jgi:hypothetical protein